MLSSADSSLIKYAVDSDVWFHADKFSSAHIYLRMPLGMTWEQIPAGLLADAAQLTKANSIAGNKEDNVNIIYTPASNLKKSGDMAVGQVAFHKAKMVKRVLVRTRENAILNRLNKTKQERYPDLEEEQRQYVIAKQRNAKAHFIAAKREEEKRAREAKAIADQKRAGYSDFLNDETVSASANDRGYDSDDFM